MTSPTPAQALLVEDAILRARARSAPGTPGLLAAAACHLGKLAASLRQELAAIAARRPF